MKIMLIYSNFFNTIVYKAKLIKFALQKPSTLFVCKPSNTEKNIVTG